MLSWPSADAAPVCSARTTALDGLRLLVRDRAAPAFMIDGDHELGAALQAGKAVLG